MVQLIFENLQKVHRRFEGKTFLIVDVHTSKMRINNALPIKFYLLDMAKLRPLKLFLRPSNFLKKHLIYENSYFESEK